MMGGRPVGFVSAVHYEHPDKPAPELWINEVGVVDACQGRGVGTRLMQAMLEHGRALGCTEAWVTTHPDNEAANALYAKLTDVKAEETRMYTFKLAAGDDR